MVEKRLRKFQGIKSECVPPDYIGDSEPDLLFICWGSSRGSTIEAAEQLKTEATRVGVLHFSQVWPLVPETFVKKITSAKKTIAVESNATAQFARLIRRETGIEIGASILRYDGLPITPEYIVARI